MKLHWNYWDVFVVLLGVSGVEAWQEVSWNGPVRAGFSTTFTCSSFCGNKCTYTWFLLGRNYTGNTLTWTPDGRDSEVELVCTVMRMPKERLFSTITSTVEIMNLISVQPSVPYAIPALNQPLDLVCHDDSSSVLLSDPSQLVLWYKDGQKMLLDKSNASLHFDSLLPSDGGFYQCAASVSQQTSVYSRGYLLSFDPWNVSISGPAVVFAGSLSIFTCVVSCNINIDCTVKWQFSGNGFPVGRYFSVDETELKWTPSIAGTSQNFTCVAENAAAGRSAEATKMVEVKGTPLSGSEPAQLNGLLLMISSLIVLFDSSRLYLIYE